MTGGTRESPRVVAAQRIGSCPDWVSAVRFVDDDTVVSSGFDGVVRLWRVGHAAPRVLTPHTAFGAPASLAVRGSTLLTGIRA